ncbi:hypothetical protein BJY52DRAFT_1193783 [Lactarius psammicola]|nr:hypothetical protein BJY52DRAFT_1193783 [Lactarius psammicola]
MQGPQIPMPTPETTVSEYSPTPTLNVSPTDTDASSNSLCKGRTVQMTFVDRVPDLDNLKTVLLALAYAYTGEGRTLQAWNGFAWNRGGPSSVTNKLIQAGSTLEFLKYSDVLFDILFVGGLLQPGGSYLDADGPTSPFSLFQIKAPAETEDIKEFVEVGATHSLPDHCALPFPTVVPPLFDLTTTTPPRVRGPRMPTPKAASAKQPIFLMPVSLKAQKISRVLLTRLVIVVALRPHRLATRSRSSSYRSSSTPSRGSQGARPVNLSYGGFKVSFTTASVQWATAFHDALYAMRDEDTEDGCVFGLMPR